VRFVNHFLDGLQENRVRFFRLFSYFWWWSVVCKRFHCIFYNQTNFLTSNWQKLTSGRAMGQNAVRPDRKEPHKRYDVRDGSSCEKVNISDIQTCWVCRAELLPFCLFLLSWPELLPHFPTMAERNEKCGLRTRERPFFCADLRLWPANIDKLKAG